MTDRRRSHESGRQGSPIRSERHYTVEGVRAAGPWPRCLGQTEASDCMAGPGGVSAAGKALATGPRRQGNHVEPHDSAVRRSLTRSATAKALESASAHGVGLRRGGVCRHGTWSGTWPPTGCGGSPTCRPGAAAAWRCPGVEWGAVRPRLPPTRASRLAAARVRRGGLPRPARPGGSATSRPRPTTSSGCNVGAPCSRGGRPRPAGGGPAVRPHVERDRVQPRSREPAREDEPIPIGASRSFYAATKLAAELLLGPYAAHYGVTQLPAVHAVRPRSE